jgi:hypothetical protein
MDHERIEALLGQPFESSGMQAMLGELKVHDQPKAKKDDPDDFLAAKAMGIELMFVDQDYIARKPVLRYGNAPMVFVGATLYSGRQSSSPAFRAFSGSLPGQARLDDTVDQLVSKLGPPDMVDEDDGVVYARVWHRGICHVGFNYNEGGVLQYVQLNWRDYMQRLTED